ncbi:MAG: hypothetical protein KF782_12060 [Labilithrix sp.]|nr:hypothetical protein [Labilithrix sp.]
MTLLRGALIPRRPRARSARVAPLLALFVPAAAHAAPPPGRSGPVPAELSTEGRAEKLFHSGEEKFDGGDYAGACDDFSESLKLGPKLGTLLNLALCHETIGKPVTAWHEFSHAAAWAAQNGQRDRHEFAAEHVRALEPKLPRVVLQLPADRAISGLDLDGEPVPEPRWYLPLYLDPGEHRLGVTAPGKQRATVAFRVTASPSDQVVYVPPLADERVATSPPAARDGTRRALGLAGLGVGAAGVVTGAVFGALAIAADERDPAVRDRATAATAAFVAGAAFAAVGGWLLWTSPRSGAPEAALVAAPQRDGAAVRLFASF